MDGPFTARLAGALRQPPCGRKPLLNLRRDVLVIGQMVKRYDKGRVVGIEQRWVQGTRQVLGVLLPENFTLSTAYIERLNATFRARLCCLVRRGRALKRV